MLIKWLPILVVLVVLAVVTLLTRKRWPVVTVLLYSIWVTVVFTPVIFCITYWLGHLFVPEFDEIADSIIAFYGEFWPFWIFCAIVIISQMLLLIIPVRIVKQRPKPRRGLWLTAVAAGALFAIVVLGIVWSVAATIFGDDTIEGIVPLLALIFLLANWIVWSCIFRTFARSSDPQCYIRRLLKWLLRGTILELLIAVPSHVIVRHKDICCADCVTAAGIATGLAVMLISFGPGIYFLYADRIESKKPKISLDDGAGDFV
ncbi:MAG TPA: hypothetical protein DIU00_16590 [Phycisphaerales bacterium]|nr:hypothetical protein [Phycisphaerales bacterium]